GMSRLILRLEKRGLVERVPDAAEGRAQRIRLTHGGLALQQQVGRDVARRITTVMTRALDDSQLAALRDLSLTMLAHAPGPAAETQQRILARGEAQLDLPDLLPQAQIDLRDRLIIHAVHDPLASLTLASGRIR